MDMGSDAVKTDAVKTDAELMAKETCQKGSGTERICTLCGKTIPKRVAVIMGFELQGGYAECDCSGYQKAKAAIEVELRKAEQQRQFEARQQKLRELFKGSMMGSRFLDRTFANFNTDTTERKTAYRKTQEFCSEFAINPRKTRGLFFSGTVGTGKTHLAAAAANKIMTEQMLPVIFGTTPAILGRIRQTYSSGGSDEKSLIDAMASVPLLVIDDIGKEYMKRDQGGNGWAFEKIYEVINRRYEDYRPTILTTNLSMAELEDRLDAAIVSRICEMCTGVRLDGPDYRKRKGAQNG